MYAEKNLTIAQKHDQLIGLEHSTVQIVLHLTFQFSFSLSSVSSLSFKAASADSTCALTIGGAYNTVYFPLSIEERATKSR